MWVAMKLFGFINCVIPALLMTCADLGGAPARAQESQSAEAKLILIEPLSIQKDKDLDFALIVPGTTAGFVTLAPNGTVTTTGGIQGVAGTPQPATFYGFGRYRQFLRLSVSQNSYQLRRVGGSQTMRLDQLTIGSQPPTLLSTNPRLFFIGSPNGFFSFSLGGRLRVAANQARGKYEGEITVTIEYF